MKNKMVQIFDDMGGEKYDKGNSHFLPINKNLHFLNMLVLKALPDDAKILCVGVGTGADIIDLAKFNKGWTFVGIEPSSAMLSQCRENLKREGLLDRCELVNGLLNEFESEVIFDASLCLFVMHFIKDMDERLQMYRDMASCLKVGGIIVMSEISADFDSPTYEVELENWKSLHAYGEASKESLTGMHKTIESVLGVISPEKTEEMIRQSGFENPVCFFQSFLIKAWFAIKK